MVGFGLKGKKKKKTTKNIFNIGDDTMKLRLDGSRG